MAPLADPRKRLIDRNIDQDPCGRCNDKEHALKSCKLTNVKSFGLVWNEIPKNQHVAADVYLKAHKGYVGPESSGDDPPPVPRLTPAHGSHSVGANPPPVPRPAPAQGPHSGGARRPPPKDIAKPKGQHGSQSEIKIRAELAPPSVNLPTIASLSAHTSTIASRKTHFDALKQKHATDYLDVHEIRPDFADTSSPPKKTVLTNHFKVELSGCVLHKYFVRVTTSDDDESTGQDAPSGKRQERLAWFIDNCDYLKNAKARFASDGLAIIISWEELGELQRGTASTDSEVLDTRKRIVRPQTTLPSGKVLDEFAERYELIYHGKVAINDLIDSCKGTIKALPISDDLGVAQQALNIVLSGATKTSSMRPFQVGSNKYFTETDSELLEHCVRACKGYFSTFKVGMGAPLLNVSSATTAFYEPMTVDKFLETFRPSKSKDFAYSHAAVNALLNVKVKIQGQGNKIKSIKEFGDPPNEQTFYRDDDDWPTVLKHIEDKNRLAGPALQKVQQSKFPCANLGTIIKKEWFPVETLEIVEHQPFKAGMVGQASTNMINFAREVPGVHRNNVVTNGRQLLGISAATNVSSPLSKANVQIDSALLEVPARRETPLSPFGRNSQGYTGPLILQNASKASWNLTGKRFLSTQNRFQGRVAFAFPGDLIERPTENDLHNMAEELIQQMKNTGIVFSSGNYAVNEREDIASINTDEEVTKNYDRLAVWNKLGEQFQEHFEYAEGKGYGLVVFFNNDSSSRHTKAFTMFKRWSEQRTGIHSLCLDFSKAYNMYKEQKGFNQYMANAAMKVNLKLGNTNHSINKTSLRVKEVFGRHVYRSTGQKDVLDLIILGSDVTHMQRESALDMPSLAAVVGSVDDTFGKFLGSMRYQCHNEEVIPLDNMTAMVTERLRAWRRRQNRPKDLPRKVIDYRDGVDAGQYTDVRKIEIEAIRNAYRNLQGNVSNAIIPHITAVFVTKRHHTRLYPKTIGSTESCAAGTIVESGITHPVYFEFFLQSHYPVAGTAKPTHYFVLEKGMSFNARDMQDFTNWLCSTYVRATLPVSYAPPCYYADRLCDRARVYMKDFYDGSVNMRSWDKIMEDETEDKRKDTWEKEEELKEKAITDVWKARYRENNGNAEGPWHSALNDTMYWM